MYLGRKGIKSIIQHIVVSRIQRRVTMVQQCVVFRFQLAGERVHSIVVFRFERHDFEVQQRRVVRAVEVNGLT